MIVLHRMQKRKYLHSMPPYEKGHNWSGAATSFHIQIPNVVLVAFFKPQSLEQSHRLHQLQTRRTDRNRWRIAGAKVLA